MFKLDLIEQTCAAEEAEAGAARAFPGVTPNGQAFAGVLAVHRDLSRQIKEAGGPDGSLEEQLRTLLDLYQSAKDPVRRAAEGHRCAARSIGIPDPPPPPPPPSASCGDVASIGVPYPPPPPPPPSAADDEPRSNPGGHWFPR